MNLTRLAGLEAANRDPGVQRLRQLTMRFPWRKVSQIFMDQFGKLG